MPIIFRLFATFSVIIFSFTLSKSQSLHGIWEGNFAKSIFLKQPPQSFVIEVFANNDSMFTGSSHLLYGNGKYEHHKISGIFNPIDSTVLFQENLIETNLPNGAYEASYKMKLKRKNNKILLEGNWKDKANRFKYYHFNKVWLHKIEDTIILKKNNVSIPFKTDSTYFTKSRIIDIQKVIEISNSERDSIEITIYDNGEVDGDSISIYLNEKSLANNKRISEKPISFYLSLNKGSQFDKIKMVAENLGSIPPNTALMIIKTTKKRYEVRLDSDLNKTATIEFVILE